MKGTIGPRTGTVVLAACLAVASCGRRGPDPEHVVVAQVAGRDVTLAQFERYLRESLPEPTASEETAPVEDSGVRSRLFDDFLDEQRLLAAASAEGIRVTDAELRAYMDDTAPPDEASLSPDPGREDEARRVLMVQKLRESVVRARTQATAGEVQSYLEEHRAELAEPSDPADRAAAEPILRARARERLLLERSEAATTELLAQVRKSVPVTVRRDRLPFAYVEPRPSEGR